MSDLDKEEFVHNGITYTITWRPKKNVLYRMTSEHAKRPRGMDIRESQLAMRAFQRKNASRIEAARKVNMH